jgi:hypothetical protein
MMQRTRAIAVIGILGLLEALLRLLFYFEAVFAGVALLQPMPPASTMNLVNSINLALGLAGLFVIAGLLLLTNLGYLGTVMVSVLTVVFDGVSAATVSATAMAGLVLPVVFLLILIPKRAAFLAGV